jgi:hypothetical protein
VSVGGLGWCGPAVVAYERVGTRVKVPGEGARFSAQHPNCVRGLRMGLEVAKQGVHRPFCMVGTCYGGE